MKIDKILNNNVVTSIGEDGIEKVIMGRGLAFKKKIGDDIEEELIEKIFLIENPTMSKKLEKLLNEIPLEYVEVCEEIKRYSENELKKELHEQIYLALTDHLFYAITRAKEGINIENAMLWEIKRIYKKEFQIGMWAIGYIKERLNVELNEDEAGFIALHIINASLGEEMPTTMNMTKLIYEILDLIKDYMKIEIDEESLQYYRLITHLKFFAQRMFSGKLDRNEDTSLFQLLKDKYYSSYRCVCEIRKFISKNYDYTLTEEEMIYLILHIQRLNKDAPLQS